MVHPPVHALILMGKQPYIPLYVGDYLKDTRVLPLSVRGAWIDLILFMWNNPVRGELTGTIEEFARMMSCDCKDAEFALQTLMQKKVADISLASDGTWTIISRRMKKSAEIGEKRSKASNSRWLKSKNETFGYAKPHANTEYEYDSEIDNDKGREVPERNHSEITSEDINKQLDTAFDEITLESYSVAFPAIEIKQALSDFRLKVRNAEATYRSHGVPGLRNAFHHHLRSIKARSPAPEKKQSNKSFIENAREKHKQK